LSTCKIKYITGYFRAESVNQPLSIGYYDIWFDDV